MTFSSLSQMTDTMTTPPPAEDTQMTDTPELKPCPFCGGTANVGWFAITCNINCDKCQYSIDTEAPEAVRENGADFTDALQDETKLAAITAWNTRHPPQVKPGLVAQAVEEFIAGSSNDFYMSDGDLMELERRILSALE
jgi:hypothetical protein